MAYLFVEFARPMAWIPPVAFIRPGMIVGIWGLAAVLLGKRRAIPRPVWYMFGFLVLMAWQVPWAVNNRWALWGLEDFAILVLGGVLPLAVLPQSLSGVRFLTSTYFFLHIPAAIHALFHQGWGLTGWMADENDLALALNSAIGVGIYLFIETRSGARKTAILLSMATMVGAIVVSNSRGGFVGFVLLGLYLLVFGPYRKVVVVCAVLVLVGLLLFAPAAYWDEIRSLTTAAEKGDTGETRLYFWGIAWKMFLDHPIFGVGTNNYGIRAPEYQDPDRTGWNVHTWGRVAHSLYFTLLPEHGIVGVVLFLGVVFWCFKTQWRFRAVGFRRDAGPDERSAALQACGITAGIFALLATGAFLSVLYYPVLWVLTGLLASLEGTSRSLLAVREPAASPETGGSPRPVKVHAASRRA